MTNNHARYFDILNKIIEAGSYTDLKQRLAAMLVYKGNIISVGMNKRKTHPFQRKFSSNEDAIFLHAETDCIVNALKFNSSDILSKSTMYVARLKKPCTSAQHYVSGLSKPCEGCSRAIAQFGIKHVYYTLNDTGFDFL